MRDRKAEGKRMKRTKEGIREEEKKEDVKVERRRRRGRVRWWDVEDE